MRKKIQPATATLEKKLARVRGILVGVKKAAVAFSGGVDSTLLLALAAETLGKKDVLAVTAVSPTYPDAERSLAVSLARRLGVVHLLLKTGECGRNEFVRNDKNRCYYCKRELFSRMEREVLRRGFSVILEATNRDDAGDYRPGERARKDFPVVSPFQRAGFSKKDIRFLAKSYGLPNWNKPSQACLASRIPYGDRITPERLKRIEQAEEMLRSRGFATVRVRDYGAIARIEVESSDFSRLLKKRGKIIPFLKRLGFTYVTLDLQGFRTGSMNEGNSG